MHPKQFSSTDHSGWELQGNSPLKRAQEDSSPTSCSKRRQQRGQNRLLRAQFGPGSPQGQALHNLSGQPHSTAGLSL